MKKYYKLLLSFLFTVPVVLSSCTYEMITPEKVTEVGNDITWTNDVLPIFVNNCSVTGCHVAGAVSPDLSEGNAYTSLVFFGYVDTNAPDQSQVYVKLTTGSMRNYASEQEKAIILKWIELGALEN